MVPKKTDRLHQQSQSDKTSREAQFRVERGLSQHHCTGFQYFTWSSCFTLWMVSWHPEDVQESLLLLISAIVCGSAVWITPCSKLRDPSWQWRHSRLLY